MTAKIWLALVWLRFDMEASVWCQRVAAGAGGWLAGWGVPHCLERVGGGVTCHSPCGGWRHVTLPVAGGEVNTSLWSPWDLNTLIVPVNLSLPTPRDSSHRPAPMGWPGGGGQSPPLASASSIKSSTDASNRWVDAYLGLENTSWLFSLM